MIRQLALSLMIGLILASAISPAFGDHLTFRGDAQRTGNVSGTGPSSPDLLWSEKLTPTGYIGGSASICDGRVYVSSWPDMSYKGEQGIGCLDAEDGSILWLNPIGGKGGASTPAICDGRVFVGCWMGDLYCLDASTGDTIWNRTLEDDPQWWGVASSPLVIEDKIFVTSFSDGTLHALDFDGDELWNLSTGNIDQYTSPAGDDDKIYFAGGDPALYCVDRSSFDILWKFATNDDPITSTPAVKDGRVYFAARDNLYAVDTTSGEKLWNQPLKGTISSPAISFDRIYIGTSEKTLNCYSASDGTLRWSVEVNGPVVSSPLVTEERVYFGTNTGKGTVYALDATTGDLVWTYLVGEYIMSAPSFSDGILYIGTDDGCIYAFGKEPFKVIFECEVLLDDGSFNLSADSGEEYSIKNRTALGSLKVASEYGQFNFTVDDSLQTGYGLLAKSIDNIEPDEGEMWMYWVNYPDEAFPSIGSDRFSLEDGDSVTFYLGDKNTKPEDALRIEIRAAWV